MSGKRPATGRGLLVVSALALWAFGCGQAEPVVYGPSPNYPTVYGGAALSGTEPDETDLPYDAAPPVDDIEEYPSVVYDGAPVYLVGGVWYRHDARGWGEYRHEPRDLGIQRRNHERDPRWAQAARRPPEAVRRPDGTERRPEVDNRSRPPRQGATERQAQPAQGPQQPAPRPEVQSQPARRAPAATPAPSPMQHPSPHPARPNNDARPAPRGRPPATSPRSVRPTPSSEHP